MVSRNALEATLLSNMTAEAAQIWLWFTLAVTFTASTILIILRSYIIRKPELWSVWLNSKLGPFGCIYGRRR